MRIKTIDEISSKLELQKAPNHASCILCPDYPSHSSVYYVESTKEIVIQTMSELGASKTYCVIGPSHNDYNHIINKINLDDTDYMVHAAREIIKKDPSMAKHSKAFGIAPVLSNEIREPIANGVALCATNFGGFKAHTNDDMWDNYKKIIFNIKMDGKYFIIWRIVRCKTTVAPKKYSIDDEIWDRAGPNNSKKKIEDEKRIMNYPIEKNDSKDCDSPKDEKADSNSSDDSKVTESKKQNKSGKSISKKEDEPPKKPERVGNGSSVSKPQKPDEFCYIDSESANCPLVILKRSDKLASGIFHRTLVL